MEPDVIMAIGVVLALVSFPPLIGSALRDQSFSRVSFLIAATALALIAIAALQKPGGYELTELPGIVIGVFRALF